MSPPKGYTAQVEDVGKIGDVFQEFVLYALNNLAVFLQGGQLLIGDRELCLYWEPFHSGLLYSPAEKSLP